jgi:hypothetical protein
MRLGSVLKRQADGVLFTVIELGHWSKIHRVSASPPPDIQEYYVKWMGSDLYVGERGPTFKLLPEEK